jgi:hypothetical protein
LTEKKLARDKRSSLVSAGDEGISLTSLTSGRQRRRQRRRQKDHHQSGTLAFIHSRRSQFRKGRDHSLKKFIVYLNQGILKGEVSLYS